MNFWPIICTLFTLLTASTNSQGGDENPMELEERIIGSLSLTNLEATQSIVKQNHFDFSRATKAFSRQYICLVTYMSVLELAKSYVKYYIESGGKLYKDSSMMAWDFFIKKDACDMVAYLLLKQIRKPSQVIAHPLKLCKSVQMAKLLLEAGVSPNDPQILAYYAVWDRRDLIHYLVDNGCPIQADPKSPSLLQRCIERERYELTGELLLRPKFNPFQRDENGIRLDSYPNLPDFILAIFKREQFRRLWKQICALATSLVVSKGHFRDIYGQIIIPLFMMLH